MKEKETKRTNGEAAARQATEKRDERACFLIRAKGKSEESKRFSYPKRVQTK